LLVVIVTAVTCRERFVCEITIYVRC